MKVKFSPDTKDDFRNYKEYLDKLKKSDSGKYSHIKPENEKKKLRDDIGSSIGDKDEHSDSIFPKEFDYSYCISLDWFVIIVVTKQLFKRN